jgi:hypothetical protein
MKKAKIEEVDYAIEGAAAIINKLRDIWPFVSK